MCQLFIRNNVYLVYFPLPRRIDGLAWQPASVNLTTPPLWPGLQLEVVTDHDPTALFTIQYSNLTHIFLT